MDYLPKNFGQTVAEIFGVLGLSVAVVSIAIGIAAAVAVFWR